MIRTFLALLTLASLALAAPPVSVVQVNPTTGALISPAASTFRFANGITIQKAGVATIDGSTTADFAGQLVTSADGVGWAIARSQSVVNTAEVCLNSLMYFQGLNVNRDLTVLGSAFLNAQGSYIDNPLQISNGTGGFAAACLNRNFRAADLNFTVQPSDGQTVTVGGKTYTFQATLTNVDGNVLIGANLAASIQSLAAAMNLGNGTRGTGSGTLYAAATTYGGAWAVAMRDSATSLSAWERSALLPGTLVTTTSTTVTGASWDGALRLPGNVELGGSVALGINRLAGGSNNDYQGAFWATNATAYDDPLAAAYPETIVISTQAGASGQAPRRIFCDTPIRGGTYSTTAYGVTAGVKAGPLGWQVQADGRMVVGGTPDGTGVVPITGGVQFTVKGNEEVTGYLSLNSGGTLYINGGAISANGALPISADAFAFINIREGGNNHNTYAIYGGTGSGDGHVFETGNPLTVRAQIRDDRTLINNVFHCTPQAAPSSPIEGDCYQSSADHHFYVYNGSAWKQLDN